MGHDVPVLESCRRIAVAGYIVRLEEGEQLVGHADSTTVERQLTDFHEESFDAIGLRNQVVASDRLRPWPPSSRTRLFRVIKQVKVSLVIGH